MPIRQRFPTRTLAARALVEDRSRPSELLLVSILAVVNSVGLSRLAEQSCIKAPRMHTCRRSTRASPNFEQQAAALKNRSPPSSPNPTSEAARKTAGRTPGAGGAGPGWRWARYAERLAGAAGAWRPRSAHGARTAAPGSGTAAVPPSRARLRPNRRSTAWA